MIFCCLYTYNNIMLYIEHSHLHDVFVLSRFPTTHNWYFVQVGEIHALRATGPYPCSPTPSASPVFQRRVPAKARPSRYHPCPEWRAAREPRRSAAAACSESSAARATRRRKRTRTSAARVKSRHSENIYKFRIMRRSATVTTDEPGRIVFCIFYKHHDYVICIRQGQSNLKTKPTTKRDKIWKSWNINVSI